MTGDDRRPERPTGHPDLDTLADLHAGALDEPIEDAVRRHVVGCQNCAAALAALDAVRADLRALPTPPLPAAVAALLDATLADLRAGSLADLRGGTPVDLRAAAWADLHTETRADLSTAAGAEAATTPGPGSGDELAAVRERRRRRLTRGLGAAAAAVAVIAAGASVTAIVRTGGGPDSATTAAGGAAGSASVPGPSGRAVPDSADHQSSQLTPAAIPTVPGYDEASLRAALPSISEQDRVNQTEAGLGSAGALADPGRRAACAGSIPNTSGTLRAVRQIIYQGRPGYVLVFADGDRLTGYVVTDACGTAPGLPATVLATVS